jgi:hypothetical protein
MFKVFHINKNKAMGFIYSDRKNSFNITSDTAE